MKSIATIVYYLSVFCFGAYLSFLGYSFMMKEFWIIVAFLIICIGSTIIIRAN